MHTLHHRNEHDTTTAQARQQTPHATVCTYSRNAHTTGRTKPRQPNVNTCACMLLSQSLQRTARRHKTSCGGTMHVPPAAPKRAPHRFATKCTSGRNSLPQPPLRPRTGAPRTWNLTSESSSVSVCTLRLLLRGASATARHTATTTATTTQLPKRGHAHTHIDDKD